MRLRHVLLGVAALAATSAGLLAALPASADRQVTPAPVVVPEPSHTPIDEVCEVAEPAPTGTAGTFVAAGLRRAPGDTIVLTIDLATGKAVADESSAHFDNAGSNSTKGFNTRVGYTLDVYYTLPAGKFCRPEVLGTDGATIAQYLPVGRVPNGMKGFSLLTPGTSGKITIKWVEVR